MTIILISKKMKYTKSLFLLFFIPIFSYAQPLKYENYKSENPYALNVIYFVPKKMRFMPDYEKRISGVLLHVKNFIDSEMKRNGYPNNKMGLMVNDKKQVKIISLNGKKEQDAYHYDNPDADANIMEEVDEYYDHHPNEKFSEHTLIILPSEFNKEGKPGWGPFYGMGVNCYALDYPGMDIADFAVEGHRSDLAVVWIGGLAHELGHGLNLPHDFGLNSERNQYGENLMSGGNSTYGLDPTFISKGSASILNSSQIFQKTKIPNYQQDANFKINAINVQQKNNSIFISGSVSSDKSINEVIGYFNPAHRDENGEEMNVGDALDVNRNYDQSAYVTKFNKNGTFSMEVPISELNNVDGRCELSLGFIFDNGLIKNQYVLSYRIKNSRPNIENFSFELSNAIPKDLWKIISVSSKSDDTEPNQLIDDNYKLGWSSVWEENLPHPHQFIIDLGAQQTFNALSFVFHDNLGGIVKDFDFYVSNDKAKWNKVGTYTTKDHIQYQKIALGKEVSGKFVKLVSKNSWQGQHFMSIIEFDLILD